MTFFLWLVWLLSLIPTVLWSINLVVTKGYPSATGVVTVTCEQFINIASSLQASQMLSKMADNWSVRSFAVELSIRR